jgi:hypothetical protein
MVIYGGANISPLLLKLAPDKGEWSLSCLSFSRFQEPSLRMGTHCVGGMEGPRAGLDAMKKRKTSLARKHADSSVILPVD